MKFVSRIFTAVLVLLLAASMVTAAFAADIDLGVVINTKYESEGTITVTVDDSEGTNAVLKGTPAKLEIPCSFDQAYVMYGDTIVNGSVLDAEKGQITFPVAKGGIYTIQSGAAPGGMLFAKSEGQSFMTNMHQSASGSQLTFCFGTPSSYQELSFSDLTASGNVSLQDKGNQVVQVNASGIGDICYTSGDVTYAFPIHNIADDQASGGNAFTVTHNGTAVSVGIGNIMEEGMVFFSGFGDIYRENSDWDFYQDLYLIAVNNIDSNTKTAAGQDFFDLISDVELSVVYCNDAAGNPAAAPICQLSAATQESVVSRTLWKAGVSASKGNCFFAKIAMQFSLQGKRYTTHCDVFYYPDPNIIVDATDTTDYSEFIEVADYDRNFSLNGRLDSVHELNYVLSSEARLMDWLENHKGITYVPGSATTPSGSITLLLPAVTYDRVIVSQPIPENQSAYIAVKLQGTQEGDTRTTMPGLIIKGFTDVANISFAANESLTMTYGNKSFTCGILADYSNSAAPFGAADFTGYDQAAKEAYLAPMPMNCSFTGFDYGIRSTDYGHVAQARNCQFTDCENAYYVDCKNQSNTLPISIITNSTFSGNKVAVCLRNLPTSLKPYDVQIHDNIFIGNNTDFRVTTPGNPHYYYFYRNYYGNSTAARSAYDPRAAVIDLIGEESAASQAVVVTNPCRRTPDDADNLWVYNQDGQYTKIKSTETGNMLIDADALDTAGTTQISVIQDYATAKDAAVWTFHNTEGGEE